MRIRLLRTLFVFIAFVFVFGAAVPPASAEDDSKAPAIQDQRPDASRPLPLQEKSFLRSFAADEWTMWSSPFRSASYNSRTVKKYVVPFALISTALLLSDRQTANVLPNSKDQAVWSGRVSQVGASYTLAGASGAIYLFGKATHHEHVAETGWLALKALAHTQLVVFGIKQITNRHRPINEDVRAGFWNGGDSFPSGHAATSFAVATVFAYQYRSHLIVPIGAYSLAGIVAMSRVSARRHWASDIFVGGSTGFLIGRYLFKKHHPTGPDGETLHRSRASLLMPEIGMGLHGPTLNWRL